LLTTWVSGYNLEPAPPARMMPFTEFSLCNERTQR